MRAALRPVGGVDHRRSHADRVPRTLGVRGPIGSRRISQQPGKQIDGDPRRERAAVVHLSGAGNLKIAERCASLSGECLGERLVARRELTLHHVDKCLDKELMDG